MMALKLLTTSRRTSDMKYVLAWMLGVPGVIILIWFLISHL